MAILSVKIIPNSSRDQVIGFLGDILKIKVQAPPEKGRANVAVCEVLAEALQVPLASVEVISGQTSPQKKISIQNLDETALLKRLEKFRL